MSEMFCPQCGKKFSTRFCPNCGFDSAILNPVLKGGETTAEPPKEEPAAEAPVEIPAEMPAPEEPVPAPAVEPLPTPDAPKKKSRKPIIIAAVAVAVIVIAAAAALLIPNLLGGGSGDTKADSVTAWIAEDGTAYLVPGDSETITIEGNCKKAYLTADRKTVVVLTTDGELYYTDPAQSEQHPIASDVGSITVIRDNGITYRDNQDGCFRFAFGDTAPQFIGNDIWYTLAHDTMTILFSGQSGDVCVLPAGAQESVTIGHAAYEASMIAVSDDGKTAVWAEYGEPDDEDITDLTINFWCDGDSEVLGTTRGAVLGMDVNADFTDSAIIVSSGYFDELYIRDNSGDFNTVRMSGTLTSSRICNADGPVSNYNPLPDDAEGFYVYVDSESGDNFHHLYWVTMDGEKERVCSDLPSGHAIRGGNIIYKDSEDEDEIYIAKLDAGTVGEGTKISDDVHYYQITNNGAYVYYIRDYDDDAHCGTLYVYDVKKGESQKIASDTSTLLNFSEDGGTVYYYKDIESLGTCSTGTLWSYTVNAKDPVKISSDVITSSLTSNRIDGLLTDTVVYRKFDGFVTAEATKQTLEDIWDNGDSDTLADINIAYLENLFKEGNDNTMEYKGNTYYYSTREDAYYGKYVYWELNEDTNEIYIYTYGLQETEYDSSVLYVWDGRESTRQGETVLRAYSVSD